MMHPRGGLTCVHFHSANGFDTQTLASMVYSLVRVTRRAAYNHYASILAEARSSVRADRIALRAITLPEGSYIPEAFIRPPEPMLACERASAPPRTAADHPTTGLVASASLSTISRTV